MEKSRPKISATSSEVTQIHQGQENKVFKCVISVGSSFNKRRNSKNKREYARKLKIVEGNMWKIQKNKLYLHLAFL